jgi:hypothetical protein
MDSVAKTQTFGHSPAKRTLSFLQRNLPSLEWVSGAWYVLTHWETWDWRIKYVLIAPAWIWCCLRARSLWFFTSANPTLTFGGFDGESKMEMYRQLPSGTYPKSICLQHTAAFSDVEKLLDQFTLPVAVKPDVGKMGFMFRKLNTLEELKRYHEKAPCPYILQEVVSYPTEVSVFYYRFPGEQKGHITGFVKKEFLEVTGDGKSTLWQLIVNYPRVRFRLEEMRIKHKNQLHRVLAPGEVFYLSQALNLSRGGKLVSLEHEKDDRLLGVFDNLSHHAMYFFFGRYDIKCASIESLKNGENFSILEYNGSGAEPHHVYGNGYNLWQACSILVWHWNILYRISRMNEQRGFASWDFYRGWRLLRQTSAHLKKVKVADSQIPVT